MSRQAVFSPGKALRGGIPICFPWFNSHPLDANLPAHGWARTSPWQVLGTRRQGSAIVTELGLTKDNFRLVYRIEMGAVLKVFFEATSLCEIFCDYEVALHTYFRIRDIDRVSITGDLQECDYYDQLTKLDHAATHEPIHFDRETDRIYYGSASSIAIQDLALERMIEIQSAGSQATVVWNPWIEKSKRMCDFGDLEYRQMCCVETANVRRRSIRLESGHTHQTSLQIASRPF
jgi:glucose-6-phosphate 1-epimerase